MLVSHEVPLQLLEESLNFNDYDFCLPHLIDKYPDYEGFFDPYYYPYRRNRIVIMDNSLHELGEALDDQYLLDKIKNYKPTYIVIPDVWGDAEATIENAYRWNRYKHQYDFLAKVKFIGVAQGESEEELFECIDVFTTLGFPKIALTYGLPFYKEYINHPNSDMALMLGRVHFITKYRNTLKNLNIHLLGCALPQEFTFYKGPEFDFIRTIDTSSPVLHGMVGTKYKSYGLDSKNKAVKIDQVMNQKLTKYDLELIEYNIKKFKTFIN